MTKLPLAMWTEWARRDDWHQRFVGSDIRQMLGELSQCQSDREAFIEHIMTLEGDDLDAALRKLGLEPDDLEAQAKRVFDRPVTVIDEINIERARQIAKGYDAAHDDEHANGEIHAAALAYLTPDHRFYPWGEMPRADSYRDALIKGCALVIANIERMDRKTSAEASVTITGKEG